MTEKKNLFLALSGRKFLHKGGDLHTQYGMVREDDIKKSKPGEMLKTNTGTNLFLLEPNFLDYYYKIKRLAQIIPLKDIGAIITQTGINKNSKVLDAGSGSGGLACFLASIVKKMYTYDIREDHINVVKKNKEFLGLDNLEIFEQNIYDKIKHKGFDVIILDLPEPWDAVDNTSKALKAGGFLVSYSPHIPQVVDFVTKVRESKEFIYLKTTEIIDREWEINGRKVRPSTSQKMGHSGFLSFARKVKNPEN